MKKSWTSGLEPEASGDVEDAFRSSKLIRRRLSELCEHKIEGSYRLSRAEYDCPNWTLLQADSVGYKRALEEIISLIEN